MTRINFYIIDSGSDEATQLFICRLTEKAWLQNNAIYIHTPTQAIASQLDEELWTFNPASFVPHQLATEESANKTVLIGHQATVQIPNTHHDVLINLDYEIPSFFSQFERVAEVIAADETSKEKGRERYRFYKDRGYALETHKLTL